MNILFVHAGAELYGADRILVNLVEEMTVRGHNCYVVLPTNGPLRNVLKTLGVSVYVRNMGVLRRRYFNLCGVGNRVSRIAGAVGYLREIVAHHEIQIIHTNTTAVFGAAIAARVCRVPHVWHVHEITTRPWWYPRVIGALLFLLSDKVVCVSDATKSHLLSQSRFLASKLKTVHNGIVPRLRLHPSSHPISPRPAEWGRDSFVVGMIGRINWWKGQDILMKATASLFPLYPRLRLLLVGGVYSGEEPMREKLDKLRDSFGDYAPRVHIADFHEDVGLVLDDIDLFALPSIEPDPFPTVVLEAMAAAKPIVAFAHGGVVEMLGNEAVAGLCWPVSEHTLAAQIRKMIESEELRTETARKCQQRFLDMFTKDSFGRKFESVYRELTSE